MMFSLGQNPFAAPMKLYQVANDTYVRPVGDDQVYLFHRPDGSYSICTDKNGNLVHLYISSDVHIVEGFEV